jgi:hypothetical protein
VGAFTMGSVQQQFTVNAMTRQHTSIVGAVRGLIDRLFERLEREQLKDVERSLAGATNERELAQRVHRLEAGEAPLN